MNKMAIVVALAAGVVLSGIIAALAPVGEGAQSHKTAEVAPVDDAWRAALPRDPAAATQVYLSRLTPEARARSDAYFTGKYWLILWNLLGTLGVMWFVLAVGFSSASRTWAERFSRFTLLQTMLYVVVFMLVTNVITFPLTVYSDFFREHQYGLSNQTFWPWFGEQMLNLALSTLIFAVAMAVIYLVIRRAPRTWWLWGAMVGLLFLVFTILIGPVFIDPLFNKYKSLEESPVKQSMLSLARANGVPVNDVMEFDASKQTNRISANVSGFLGTTAIRLNDNLMTRCTPAEILAVMGHEMGHYVLNHIDKILLVFGLVLVAGFAFIRWSFDWVVARWGGSWGVRGVADAAGLPLFIALFSLYGFVITPIINTTIRTNEIEADLFSVNATRQADGFAEVSLKLSEYRKVEPGAVEEFLFYDHPSPRNRIFAAMRWKAEQSPAKIPLDPKVVIEGK
jgi:STE24 endopeptidase